MPSILTTRLLGELEMLALQLPAAAGTREPGPHRHRCVTVVINELITEITAGTNDPT